MRSSGLTWLVEFQPEENGVSNAIDACRSSSLATSVHSSQILSAELAREMLTARRCTVLFSHGVDCRSCLSIFFSQRYDKDSCERDRRISKNESYAASCLCSLESFGRRRLLHLVERILDISRAVALRLKTHSIAITRWNRIRI